MKCLVALLFLAACACAAKHFEDCDPKHTNKIKTVKVNGKEECKLKSQTDTTFEFVLESRSSTSDNVTVVATFVDLTYDDDRPLKDKDGCKTGFKCPLKKKEKYTYTNKMKWGYAPTSKHHVYWEFLDKKEDYIWCIKLICNA